jgi:ATP-binding cassette, subfamily C (CFTR/MRP), member 1
VYRKSLRLGTKAKQSAGTGEVLNLMSNDSGRLQDTTFLLHFVWAAPVLVFVCFFLVAQVIGYIPTLAGYGVFVIMIPFSFIIARILEKIRQSGLKTTDSRVKSTNEIFNAIKTIKLYALETIFSSRVEATRSEEMRVVQRYQLVKGVNTCLNYALVPLISTVAFIFFVLRGGELTASVAFSAISLFNLLKWPFTLLKEITTGLVEARISLGRMQTFLDSEEIPERYVFCSKAGAVEPYVAVRDGEFNWDPESGRDHPTLSDVNVEITKGQLVCIVGPVGSGKTSLLSCVLGEISRISGSVQVDGRICYAPQAPFLQHASVRENIIFGKDFDQEFYSAVIDACGITTDLESFQNGDHTVVRAFTLAEKLTISHSTRSVSLLQVGERGINLSGGQKARIGLARAIYADGDVYLLDDPLSAVDVLVGTKLFWDGIVKMLRQRGKIVLLVTHQLQYVAHSDLIIVVESGKISHQGSFESLKQAGIDFEALHEKFAGTKQIASHESTGKGATQSGKTEEALPDQRASALKLVQAEKPGKQAEERKVGSVSKHVYSAFFSGQPLWWMLAGAAVFLHRSLDLAQNFWIVRWSSVASGSSNSTSGAPSDMTTQDTRFYLSVYVSLTLIGTLVMLGQECLIAFAGIRSARQLYDRMVRTLMFAKMEFFDVTPKGRIMSRVSSDTDQVDNAMSGVVSTFAIVVLQMLGTLIVIFISSPLCLLALVPLLAYYARMYLLYISSHREVARLQSLSRAPIFSLFGETLSGLHVVRAFNAAPRFQHEIEKRVNTFQQVVLHGLTMNRWLGTRMDFTAVLVTLSLCTAAIFARGSASAALIAAGITYSLLSSEVLNVLVRVLSDMEGKMNSVERMDQYCRLDTEVDNAVIVPPASWPSKGVLEFQEVKMRYRDGLPLVLKGISLAVKSGEKIGIVGRTGAGKTSLTTALFRLADLAGGKILIDGIDLSSLSVQYVRSKLAIIPQDPVIFDGSIRRNLDPSEVATDEDLWDVLRRVHLTTTVTDMGGLDACVTEEGSNMSAGQRQLLCIGRALLRKAKILLLDEASSSIDMETDHLLQNTIREEFVDCTVLTIAHRLQTST